MLEFLVEYVFKTKHVNLDYFNMIKRIKNQKH